MDIITSEFKFIKFHYHLSKYYLVITNEFMLIKFDYILSK